MIQIIRTNLLTGKSTKTAAYDGISLTTAIEFLEMAATEEAKTFGGYIRSKDLRVGDQIEYQRILSEVNQVDVVSFKLKFT